MILCIRFLILFVSPLPVVNVVKVTEPWYILQRKTCFSFAYFMIFNDTHLQYSPEELIVTYSVT